MFLGGAPNIGVNCFRDARCDSLGPSDSEGTDGQMHQRPSPSVEDSVALERRSAAAPAHSESACGEHRSCLFRRLDRGWRSSGSPLTARLNLRVDTLISIKFIA